MSKLPYGANEGESHFSCWGGCLKDSKTSKSLTMRGTKEFKEGKEVKLVFHFDLFDIFDLLNLFEFL